MSPLLQVEYVAYDPIRNSQLCIFPNALHMVWCDEPAIFAAEVELFFHAARRSEECGNEADFYCDRSHTRTRFTTPGSGLGTVIVSRLPSILKGRSCFEPTYAGVHATTG